MPLQPELSLAPSAPQGAVPWQSHQRPEQRVKKDSFEAAQLAAPDLDPVRIAVIADRLFGYFVFFCHRKRLRAFDLCFDPFSLEYLRYLFCIHGNNVRFTSS
jgi:hypothetical protein